MTAVSLKLLGSLPNGDGDGLSHLADDFDKDRKQIRVAVVLFDVDRYEEKTDDGTASVRLRVRRIEAISEPDDAAAMERLLMREFERRTGQTTLPIDLEGDVMSAFAELRASMPTVGDGGRSWEDGQDPRDRDQKDPPGSPDFQDGDDPDASKAS